MGVFAFFEISYREPMMNLEGNTFIARLATSTSGGESSLPCLIPSGAIGVSRAAFPSWVIFTTNKFRLPFCHTPVIAKGLFGVEVTGWARYIFTTPSASPSFKVGPGWIRTPLFANFRTSARAINLIPFACAGSRVATYRTKVDSPITPSIFEIAGARAARLMRAAIMGVERISAIDTLFNFVGFSHDSSIRYIVRYFKLEEKYCEIAVNRLRQGVLAL
jgi:hypothetical protein